MVSATFYNSFQKVHCCYLFKLSNSFIVYNIACKMFHFLFIFKLIIIGPKGKLNATVTLVQVSSASAAESSYRNMLIDQRHFVLVCWLQLMYNSYLQADENCSFRNPITNMTVSLLPEQRNKP